MNSSNSGSARLIIGSRVRTLPKVCESAQVTIGRALSAVRPYQRPARIPIVTSVAGAKLNSELIRAKPGSRRRGGQPGEQQQRERAPETQRLPDPLTLLGHEVGQPVAQEPVVGRGQRVQALRPRHAPTASSSRVRTTSWAIVSTSESTPSNLTMPRIRETNEISTSSP